MQCIWFHLFLKRRRVPARWDTALFSKWYFRITTNGDGWAIKIFIYSNYPFEKTLQVISNSFLVSYEESLNNDCLQ